MAKRAQQESGEERVTAKSRPMMNLTARTTSIVSSSASSNPVRTSYGYQDPGRSVLSDDRTGKPLQPSQPDYSQEDYGRSWSYQEWTIGAAEHDRSEKPEEISWDTVREIRALSHRYHVRDDSQRSSATMLRVYLFRYQAVRSPPVSVFTTLVPQSCWGDLHTCCSHCVSRVACRLRARVVVVEPPTAS